MSLKRTSLNLYQLVRMRPDVRNVAMGIQCAICQRPVDYEEIVEARPGQTTAVKVLVRCHGAEDLQVLDMGSVHWTPEDFRTMKNRLVVFRPDQGERPFSAGREEKGPAKIVNADGTPSNVILASERFSGGEKAG